MSDVTIVSTGLRIAKAIDSAPVWRTPAWGEFGTPVVDRGAYAIFPLAVGPYGAEADRNRRSEIFRAGWQLREDFIHLYGGDFVHGEMSVDVDDGYGRRLIEAGATDPDRLIWWTVNGRAMILVYAIDAERELETLALHVVPRGWAWTDRPSSTKRDASHARRMLRDARAADATWSRP